MQSEVKCIALRTVRFSDSKNLLTAWTDAYGAVTFAVTAGKSRTAARIRALTSPFATFSAVADIRSGRNINTLRDIMPGENSLAMTQTPVKAATAAFLAQTLDLLLRDTPAEAALDRFLQYAADVFARADSRTLANFNISFLYHLAEQLGVGPDTNEYRRGKCFDIKNGRFIDAAPLHNSYLAPDAAAIVPALARIPLPRCDRLPFDKALRRRIFDTELQYYSLHLRPLDKLDSLIILRELFG